MHNSKSSRTNIFNIILLCFLLLLVFLSIYIINQGLHYEEEKSLSSFVPASFGLDEELPKDTNIYGSLNISADYVGEENIPQIYTYNFKDKKFQLIVDIPGYSYSKANDKYGVLISYISDTQDPDGLQPTRYLYETGLSYLLPGANGYNEQDLTTSPDQTHYAYSYQLSPEADPNSIEDTFISLHNYKTGAIITIEKASEPEWLNQGKDMLYMKSDGLYRYNLATKSSSLVSGVYANLSTQVDIGVSTDSSTIVLTSPSAHLIAVFSVVDKENVTVEEPGAIVTPDTRYRDPVVSADGRLYVVMAAKDVAYDKASGTYSEINAEIRALNSSDILDTISFPEFTPGSVTLESWDN